MNPSLRRLIAYSELDDIKSASSRLAVKLENETPYTNTDTSSGLMGNFHFHHRHHLFVTGIRPIANIKNTIKHQKNTKSKLYRKLPHYNYINYKTAVKERKSSTNRISHFSRISFSFFPVMLCYSYTLMFSLFTALLLCCCVSFSSLLDGVCLSGNKKDYLPTYLQIYYDTNQHVSENSTERYGKQYRN